MQPTESSGLSFENEKQLSTSELILSLLKTNWKKNRAILRVLHYQSLKLQRQEILNIEDSMKNGT